MSQKHQNASKVFEAFCVRLFLCVFPSWEPLLDHPTAVIQHLFVNLLMGFYLTGLVALRLALHLPPLRLRYL